MIEPQPPPGPRPPEPIGPQVRLEPQVTRPLAASIRQLLGQDLDGLKISVATLTTIGGEKNEGDQNRIDAAREGTTNLEALYTSITSAGVLGITPRENGSTFEVITQSLENPPPGEVVLEGDNFQQLVVALSHQVASQANGIMRVEMIDNENLQEQAGNIAETTMAINQKILSWSGARGIKMTTDQEGNTSYTLLYPEVTT